MWVPGGRHEIGCVKRDRDNEEKDKKINVDSITFSSRNADIKITNKMKQIISAQRVKAHAVK